MTKDSRRRGLGLGRQTEREREIGVKRQEGGGKGVKAGLHMSHQRHWGGLAAMPRRMVPPMAIQISCKVVRGGGEGAHTQERTARGTGEDTTNHDKHTLTHAHITLSGLNRTSKHSHTFKHCSNSKGDHHVQLYGPCVEKERCNNKVSVINTDWTTSILYSEEKTQAHNHSLTQKPQDIVMIQNKLWSLSRQLKSSGLMCSANTSQENSKGPVCQI